MDGQIPQRWSVPATAGFAVSQGEECVVRIETEKGEGGEKFKILSLTVTFRDAD